MTHRGLHSFSFSLIRHTPRLALGKNFYPKAFCAKNGHTIIFNMARNMYRLVQKKGTVLLSTSLAWPAVAGCNHAETFSQLSPISFAQPCTGKLDNAMICLVWHESDLCGELLIIHFPFYIIYTFVHYIMFPRGFLFLIPSSVTVSLSSSWSWSLSSPTAALLSLWS